MLISIKELEDYLAIGKFEYDSYIELHGGPHVLCLHSNEKIENSVVNKYLHWVDIGGCYYNFTIEAYGDTSEDTEKYQYKVEELRIRRRGPRRNDLPKYAKKRKHSYYWESEYIFKGQVETLDDLKKLFKQLGIDENN